MIHDSDVTIQDLQNLLIKCSGLEVMRYDAESLHGECGGGSA
jgi:hypothetical protein